MKTIDADALLWELADRGLTGCAAVTAEELEDIVASVPTVGCETCGAESRASELQDRYRAMRGTIDRQTRIINGLQAEVDRLRRMLDGCGDGAPAGKKTKRAELVRDNLPGFMGRAALYRCDPPMPSCPERLREAAAEYVVVSSIEGAIGGEPETCIFPADKTGEVTSWLELDGSTRGDLSHEEALGRAGYAVVVK